MRRKWWLPALLVVVWLGLGALGGPYAGKLAEVAENDNAAFLPDSAEATEVARPAAAVQRAGGRSRRRRRRAGRRRHQRRPPTSSTDGAPRSRSIDGVAGPPQQPPALDGRRGAQLVVLDQRRGRSRRGRRGGPRRARRGRAGRADGAASPVRPGRSPTCRRRSAASTACCCWWPARSSSLILIVVYRSPVLPLLVLVSAVFALGIASVRRVPAGRERRAEAQRPEPGHPVHPRVRRGHRLRAAARVPVPRGAARHRGPVRRGRRPRGAPRSRRSPRRPAR